MSDSSTLGAQIRDLLTSRGIETPTIPTIFNHPQAGVEGSIQEIMVALGLNLSDDSLKETPQRVAKMFCEEIFYGLNYANFPKTTTIKNHMAYDEMLVTKCQVRSMCEHHFVPFMGNAYIAYIPNEEILGLSKFNR